MAVKCIDSKIADRYALYQGDSCDILPQLPAESIDFSVYSCPFASLYTYSNSERDIGNCQTHQEFFEHYAFIATEVFRLIKPGRLVSLHCMLLPTSKERDGFIGLSDFRGKLIAAHQDAGFIFHSEVVIWKDPVTAMQRTKALGLLHKQVLKDSCMSRQGIPDYLITMRKPGLNASPVSGPFEDWIGDPELGPNPAEHDGNPIRKSIAIWQRYASPVWMDINPSDTLQRESAREDKDERHICPMQLGVIRRALELWTNPGDVVLSPFAGIGSEGYVALQQERKFIGVELKESYYRQAARNLDAASNSVQQNLFGFMTSGPGDPILRENLCPEKNENKTTSASADTSATSTSEMNASGVASGPLEIVVEASAMDVQEQPKYESMVGVAQAEAQKEKKKRGRPRKTDPSPMTVLSETGVKIVQESFLDDDVPDWVK